MFAFVKCTKVFLKRLKKKESMIKRSYSVRSKYIYYNQSTKYIQSTSWNSVISNFFYIFITSQPPPPRSPHNQNKTLARSYQSNFKLNFIQYMSIICMSIQEVDTLLIGNIIFKQIGSMEIIFSKYQVNFDLNVTIMLQKNQLLSCFQFS